MSQHVPGSSEVYFAGNIFGIKANVLRLEIWVRFPSRLGVVFEGPGVLLGKSWGAFEESWGSPGRLLGGLGVILGHLGSLLGGLGVVLAGLGALLGDLGVDFGALSGVLWRSCAVLEVFWPALRDFETISEDLGAQSGCLEGVLGGLGSLCMRSWPGLGRSWCALGRA